MNILDKLKVLKTNGKLATIYRDVPKDAEGVSYYILNYSKEFVLGQYVDEFMLNGYAFFRICDINRIRCNKFDNYIDKIIKKEGLKDKVGIDFKINLNSWNDIFKSLKLRGKNIQILGEEPDIDEFFIGKIVRINKASFKGLYFDATGKWDKSYYKIPFSDITLVIIEDNYVNTFSKYTRY